MILQSYVRLISDNTELFSYEDTALPHYGGFTYKLGDIILNLLDLDIDEITNEYLALLHDMIEPSLISDDNALADIRLRFSKLDIKYPALRFHTHLIYSCFADVFCNNTFSINPDLLTLKNSDRLLYENEMLRSGDEILKDHETMKQYFDFILKVLIADITYWKDQTKSEVEMILKYSSLDFYTQLSPAQRLYFLDRVEDRVSKSSPFKYAGYIFKTQMVLNGLNNEIAAINPKVRAEEILNADTSLNETYILNSLYDYIQFELIKLVLAYLSFIECQNCGRIIIPRGRPDIKYCDKIAEGETLPCDAIGALRVYQHKVANDPIFYAYNKAYKRMNSRVNYYTISKLQFCEWSDKSREMRDKCVSGEISLEEFNKWLGNKPISVDK